ncbi:MAG: carboxypeptidase-like regulatory domain-containing protein, partial [Planctomycetota bacterium]|nr:carboxypeptidase-like regulatory domain-containing protein [Planctomycetota bacterium]
MMRTAKTSLAVLAIFLVTLSADADTISGKVVDSAGKPMVGVMISAFTVESKKRKSVSVFSQADGSFSIEGLLYEDYYKVRARLMGQLDAVKRNVKAGDSDLSFSMKPATGDDLEDQRTADSGFDMLKWTSMKDKENYKMMCSYCHQTGSKGWRSPELPVDWDT